MNRNLELGLNRHQKGGDDRLSSNIIWLLDQLLELMAENLAHGDASNTGPRLPSILLSFIAGLNSGTVLHYNGK
jgi:hypothetical protein